MKLVSLFCGCGGFDLGFKNAGFDCIAAFDHDPDAAQVYSENFSRPVNMCDLSTEAPSPADFRGVDVVTAGPPCQGFSTVGKRRLDDPRNSLLVRAAQIAVSLAPKFIVVENVIGVKSGSHKIYWNQLLALLSANGYRTCEILCDASFMGVPQIRKRLVLIASRARHALTIKLPSVPGGTLRTALAGVEGKPNHEKEILQEGSPLALIAAKIKPGQKLSNVRCGLRSVHTWHIPAVFGETTIDEQSLLEVLVHLRRRNRKRDFGDADPVMARVINKELGFPTKALIQSLIMKKYIRKLGSGYDLTHGFNGKFRKLEWDKPSHTVDTRFGSPRYFLHPCEPRGFTVREAARIQGFPDNFVFHGTKAAQYRMVGNAVPPPVSESIAHALKSFIVSLDWR